MSWRNAPSVAAGLAEATRRWPDRSRIHDGTLGDAAHARRQSDHNPDARGVVHAFDLTHDPAHGVDCDQLAAHLVRRRDRRVKNLIWDRRICVATDWVWNPYRGLSPHTDHLHVSIRDTREAENDVSPWWDLEIEGFLFVPSMQFQTSITWLGSPGASQLAGSTMSTLGSTAERMGQAVRSVVEGGAQQLGQVVSSLAPPPRPLPGHQNPPPLPGYAISRNRLPTEVVHKADEIIKVHSAGCAFCLHGRTSKAPARYPLGSQTPLTIGGRNYLFAIHWHIHGPNEHVADGYKQWHHGVTVFVRRS